MEITNRLIKHIEKKQTSLFTKLIVSAKDNIDYDLVDKALLNEREFDIEAKINYYTYCKRDKFHKDLIEDFKKNYYKYDFYSIFFIATFYKNNKEDKIFYMMESFAKIDTRDRTCFYYLLLTSGLYLDFIEALIKSNNTILKIKACLYLDIKLISRIYDNNINFITTINTSDLSSKEKINYLIDLSNTSFLLPNELEYLKNIIINISDNYNDKLNHELYELDEELVEYNKEVYASSLEELISSLEKGKSYLHK